MTERANNYTIVYPAEEVSVAEFRQRTSHLERLVNYDFHACSNALERARWAAIATRVGGELIATTCKRAKADDWARRETAIETSSARLKNFDLRAP